MLLGFCLRYVTGRLRRFPKDRFRVWNSRDAERGVVDDGLDVVESQGRADPGGETAVQPDLDKTGRRVRVEADQDDRLSDREEFFASM